MENNPFINRRKPSIKVHQRIIMQMYIKFGNDRLVGLKYFELTHHGTI